MKHDPLGAEMKALEAAHQPPRLRPDLPIYARIDGRAFSSFTRDLERPFDPRMLRAMQDTARALLEETSAVYAYTQSDEISLVWAPGGHGTEAFFGGRIQKMASILSGMATAYFMRALLDPDNGLADRAALCPHFDARVCQMPDRESAARMIAWRGLDAERNAVQMAAQARLSHKSLQGVPVVDQIARLEGAGIRMADYPEAFRHGTQMSRVLVRRPLAPTELARIPERHRPDPGALVLRCEVRHFMAAPPHRRASLDARIFDNDETGAPIATPGRKTTP